MSLLTRFKSDPQNLIGPNLGREPVREINLSGTEISFNCPPQTAQIPAFSGGNNFDINTAGEVEFHNINLASKLIFSSGWNFYDKSFMGTGYGGLDVGIVLLHEIEKHDKDWSLLKKKYFERWLIERNERNYGSLNKEKWENRGKYASPITPEGSFWQYPKTAEDLQWHNYNNRDWVYYETFQPRRVPRMMYETAISHQHVVSVSWKPNAFHGLDFFSPKHNLRAATKSLMESIMATMKIELSPDAQYQYDEAMSK